MLWVLLFIAVGLIAEIGIKVFLTRQYFRTDIDQTSDADNLNSMSNADKLVAAFVTIVPDIIGLFVFFGAAYFSYFSFIWIKSPYLQLLFLSILVAVTLARIVAILSQLIFSPKSERLRILPVATQNAIYFHKVLIGPAVYIIFGLMSTVVVFNLGAERSTISIISIFFSSILS